MIYEELYITVDGERLRLDLDSPSGITLNFKSNLFSDLSKITSSFSYTFKLPMTVANRRALGSPEDLRVDGGIGRRKAVCEYRHNGVDLFGPANLYVDSCGEDSYSAVMTWGVVSGFAELKDDDKTLRELDEYADDIARYNDASAAPLPTEYDNASPWLLPYRGWEVYEASAGRVWCTANGNGPISKCTYPVVPIRFIIEKINGTYGTRFNLGSRYLGSEKWDAASGEYADTGDSEYVSRGVVPLVTAGLTDYQLSKYKAVMSGFAISKAVSAVHSLFDGYLFYYALGNKYVKEKVVTFNLTNAWGNDWFAMGTNDDISTPTNWMFYKKSSTIYVEKLIFDGFITVGYKVPTTSDEATALAECRLLFNHFTYERDEESSNGVKYLVKELETVSGVRTGEETRNGTAYYLYTFDFRESSGYGAVEIDDANGIVKQYPLFLIFDPMPEYIQLYSASVTPSGKVSGDVTKGYYTDIFSNLPDVGCLEFMKSLFYVMGAFPKVNANGEVVPMFYKTLKERLAANDCSDWSDKVEAAVDASPEKVAFAISGFGQRNYYLLKNDELEPKTAEPGDDIYEEGKMAILCDSGVLDKEKTVTQLPWHGPLLRVGKPKIGADGSRRDMKYREYDPEKDEWSDCEAEPSIGLIFGGAEGTYDPTADAYAANGNYRMFMRVANPFIGSAYNPSYSYLQEIAYRPYVVTEYIRLDEFDLRDMDYTRPVYLGKYNSHFAVISVQRDGNGRCKCELIKLPNIND